MKFFLKFAKKVVRHYKRKFALQKWLQENRNNEIFIVVGGFGDTVWFMTFWEQYKKKENLRSYKILTEPKYADMFHLYGENNLILDKVDFLWTLLPKTAYSRKKKYSNIHPMIFPHYYNKKEIEVIENYRSEIGIMMDDYFRFGCFDLSYEDDSPVKLPVLAETDVKIETKKNILLIPYTKSRINVPVQYWEEIAEALKKEGYTVYTNIGLPKEKPIAGTVPLSVKITELPAVLRKYDFISLCGRCGLADWLFVNECKQIVVHSCLENPKNRNEWLNTNVERKDSFKIMKRKLCLNENNAEDLYFYIDNASCDYALQAFEAVKKIETLNKN